MRGHAGARTRDPIARLTHCHAPRLERFGRAEKTRLRWGRHRRGVFVERQATLGPIEPYKSRPALCIRSIRGKVCVRLQPRPARACDKVERGHVRESGIARRRAGSTAVDASGLAPAARHEPADSMRDVSNSSNQAAPEHQHEACDGGECRSDRHERVRSYVHGAHLPTLTRVRPHSRRVWRDADDATGAMPRDEATPALKAQNAAQFSDWKGIISMPCYKSAGGVVRVHNLLRLSPGIG